MLYTLETIEYYRRRASEYEAIYFRPDPVRLAEQEDLARAIRRAMNELQVLEVAAGTGFWTVHAAATAKSVTAIDAAPETLAIARLKPLPTVNFTIGDAYDLGSLASDGTGAMACCWLSHVPRARIAEFLAGLHRKLQPGATVLFADNVFVDGLGGELLTPNDEPDTYKIRTLESGESTKVLKNYYDRDELHALLAPSAKSLEIEIGSHFWRAEYRLPKEL